MPKNSAAFAVLYMGVGVPSRVTLIFGNMGLDNASGYNVTEVFDNKYIGIFKPSDKLTVSVNPSGVFFGKAVAIQQEDDDDEFW